MCQLNHWIQSDNTTPVCRLTHRILSANTTPLLSIKSLDSPINTVSMYQLNHWIHSVKNTALLYQLLSVVVDALFVVTNFGGTMNNVSPTFAIPDHLQYCVCRQIGPVCNVVDPGTWWSSSASAAWDTACDDVLF